MSNFKNQHQAWEELLNQDQVFTATQYAEYRQKLRVNLQRVAREATLVRRVTLVIWGVLGLLMVAGAVVDFNRDTFSEITRLSVIAAIIVVTSCAVTVLVLYLVRYRPRLWRFEQATALEQLRQELRQLQDRLPPSS
jgi:uncharacterized membrane protein YcjF (UPF0283 family)